jgi:pyruvate dehydrogenase E1 component beta subunit
MPATVADARDLLISSVLCEDPVIFIDDRWLYDATAELPPVEEKDLKLEGPRVLAEGEDVTIVASGFSTRLALEAHAELLREGITTDVVDLRVLNPLDPCRILESVRKTRRLVVVDGGWRTCGIAAEVLALVAEGVPPETLLASPKRIALPDAPAPTSRALEQVYYPSTDTVVTAVKKLLTGRSRS